MIAFGAGMILQKVIFSFIKMWSSMPEQFFPFIWTKYFSGQIFMRRRRYWFSISGIFCTLFVFYIYFHYFHFSVWAKLFMITLTPVFVYQLMVIGGKISLAPFGRFATFAMLPAFLLFGLNTIQLMLISLFVSLSGAIAVDIMFGNKMAQLTNINRRQIFWMQLLGLVVSAFFWTYLFTIIVQQFGIGSELIAQRARARALLITMDHFDYSLLLLGAAYGFIIERASISALLVFTGLLFPIAYSIMLIAGGLLAFIAQDKEEWDPFWSGVFAASSLWMVLRAFA